jgi:hypothetical protein
MVLYICKKHVIKLRVDICPSLRFHNLICNSGVLQLHLEGGRGLKVDVCNFVDHFFFPKHPVTDGSKAKEEEDR